MIQDCNNIQLMTTNHVGQKKGKIMMSGQEDANAMVTTNMFNVANKIILNAGALIFMEINY